MEISSKKEVYDLGLCAISEILRKDDEIRIDNDASSCCIVNYEVTERIPRLPISRSSQLSDFGVYLKTIASRTSASSEGYACFHTNDYYFSSFIEGEMPSK